MTAICILPHEYRRPAKRYAFKGVWMTVAEIAALTGVDKASARRRLERGQPVEQRNKPGKPAKRYLFRGERLTAYEIAALLGVSVTTVRNRISGETVLDTEELSKLPREHHGNARIIFHRGESRSISAWAKHVGINEKTLRHRLDRGWPFARAITEPVHVSNKSIIAKLIRLFRVIANHLHLQRIFSAFDRTDTKQTGGYQPTSPNGQGTGVGRHALERGKNTLPTETESGEGR